jgi:hypothetical protein
MAATQQVYQPRILEIEMSHFCNLRCPGCAVLPEMIAHKHKLSAESLLSLLSEAEQAGITGYSLTGGEPFLDVPLLLQVLKQSPLDLIKINSNGFIFATEKSTRRVFSQLRDAGFGIKNKRHKSFLNISIGQQTAAGIPVENAVHAVLLMPEFFPEEKTGFSLNVYNPEVSYSRHVIEKFLAVFERAAGIPFPSVRYPIKLITRDGCYGIMDQSVLPPEEKLRIPELLDFFDREKIMLNCSDTSSLPDIGDTFPRMLIRASGDVYSCTGFDYIHKIGSLSVDTLRDIIRRANAHAGLRRAFHGGLRTLYRDAVKVKPDLAELTVQPSISPCKLCGMLSSVLTGSYGINHTTTVG